MLAKKSLGQNFLRDKNIIKKIVNLVDVKNRNILEIGPGTGALTEEIIKKNPKTLTLIEKDNRLYENLKDTYFNEKNIKIINQDILKYDLDKLKKKNLIIFGNLPYNISSQILVKIIKMKNLSTKLKDVVFMFQKELGEKIIADFPSKNYGRLSILVNLRLIHINKFNVSSNCFYPKPKVDSTIIHFKPKTKIKYEIINIENLEKITSIFFSNKRKIIKKNMKKILNEKKINLIKNLNLNLRPENLSPDTYYKITNLFEN